MTAFQTNAAVQNQNIISADCFTPVSTKHAKERSRANTKLKQQVRIVNAMKLNPSGSPHGSIRHTFHAESVFL